MIPRESLTTQHGFLILDVQLKTKKIKESNSDRQLKGDKHLTFKKKIIEDDNWESQSSANLIWDKMFKKVAKPISGESKGFGLRDKEARW